MPELPIATGWYEDPAKPIAAQECANWIPQIPLTNAATKMQLKTTSGIDLFTTAGNKVCRGMHVMDGLEYSVNGQNFYRNNEDGTSDDLGAITGVDRVSMADNGTQICIVVPGADAYIYSVAGGLVQITDPDFLTTLGPSQQVVFKDARFIHYNNNAPASNQPIFFVSDLNDGLSYDPLFFGTAEVDPDAITGLHVNRNQLYVGGTITIEPFQNVGGEDFPYQRIQGAVIQKGFRSKFGIADHDNSFGFIGGGLNEQAAIWKFTGSSASKISSAAIDNIIQQLTDEQIDDVFATTHAEDGEYFLTFHFPERTFSYCAAVSALKGSPVWIERKSKDVNGKQINWRVNHIVDAYGFTLVGDNQSGRIGKLNRKSYKEYEDTIKRVVATQPFGNEGRDVNVAQVELLCESGTATATGEGSDPYVSREVSDDGGYTFGNKTSRSLGKQGNYKARQIWRKEGSFTDTRVYRFIHDAPIKGSIIGLTGEFQ